MRVRKKTFFLTFIIRLLDGSKGAIRQYLQTRPKILKQIIGTPNQPIVGEEVASRRPEDFLYMFGMDLIDFDVERNKKNIARFQKIKWRLNSRWPP
jgi:hypothetical protein